MRLALYIWAFLVSIFFIPDVAQAQSIGQKRLCEGLSWTATQCDPANAPRKGDPVYYEFEVYGGPTATTLDITESYSPPFVPVDAQNAVVCVISNGPNAGDVITPTVLSAGPPFRFSIDLAGGEDAVCRMQGSFTEAGTNATNTASITGGNAPNIVNTNVSGSDELDVDLEIDKQLLSPTVLPFNIAGTPGTARYRIEIITDKPVYLGDWFRVFDELALFQNGSPIEATLNPGSTCVLEQSGGSAAPIPNCVLVNDLSGPIYGPSWTNFASWGLQPGTLLLLEPGQKIVIEYEVTYSVPDFVDCVKAEDAEGIRNRAFLGLAGTSAALDDKSDGNNIAQSNDTDLPLQTGVANVDQNCDFGGGGSGPPPPPSPLTITKTGVTNAQWNNLVWFEIVIKNTSSDVTAYDLDLQDVLSNMQGTPNFDAWIAMTNQFVCPASGCTQTSPGSSNPPAGPVKNFRSYYDRFTIWTGTAPSMAPGETWRVRLVLNVKNPTCDFSPQVVQKRIRNLARLTFKADHQVPDGNGGTTSATFSYAISDDHEVKMPPPPPCQVSVEKTSEPIKRKGDNVSIDPEYLIFDHWKTYTLRFSSAPANATHSSVLRIGTLVDIMRIQTPQYAAGLTVDYDWQCTDLSGGGVRNFDSSGSGTTTVNHVSAPHQGVRVMEHANVVEFDPGAILECRVKVKVQRPPSSDPYCYSERYPWMENIALMDGSRFFNASMPWPHAPEGMTWAGTRDKLPRCYNLVVNKFADPGVVTKDGGPITYTVTITNANEPGTGGDLEFPPGFTAGNHGPHFIDEFRPGGSNSIPSSLRTPVGTNPCLPLGAHPCDAAQGQPDPSRYHFFVSKLEAGKSISYSYEVAGPYDPHQICNRIEFEALKTELAGTLPDRDWYPKDAATWTTEACVLVRTSLEVEKIWTLPGWVTFDPDTEATLEVKCNAPSGFDDFTRDLVVSPNNPSGRIDRIVIGSECEVDEVKVPDPKAWGDCEWEQPIYELGRKFTLDGSADPHRMKVANTLRCEPPSGDTTLDIKKELISDPSCAQNSICRFRITVTNIGQGYFADELSITDTFGNGPLANFYQLGVVDPHNWDWQCQQQGQTVPITCTESYVELAPNGGSTYFDIELDLMPDGTNCAVLDLPLQSPKPYDCASIGTPHVDLSGLTFQKLKLTPGNCEGANGLICEFQFVITNPGNTDFSGPITITDTIQTIVPTGGAGITLSNVEPGWNCGSNVLVVTCSKNPVIIPAGSSITVNVTMKIVAGAIPPAGNCAEIGDDADPNRPPESCVDFNDSADPDRNFTILKEVLSNPLNCTYNPNDGNRCTFRITVTNTGTTTYNGSLAVEDIYSDMQTGNTLSKAIAVTANNGWNCPSPQAATSHTCTKYVTNFAPGDTQWFEITLDMTGSPPVYTENCAWLQYPILSERPVSCVELGQQTGVVEQERKKKKPRFRLRIGIGIGGGRGRQEPEPREPGLPPRRPDR